MVKLEANAWRLVRRLLAAHPEPRPARAIRNWVHKRHEQRDLAGLAAAGLVEPGPETADWLDREYRLTPKGVAAADLGEYPR